MCELSRYFPLYYTQKGQFHACILCDAVSFSRAPFVHGTIKKIHNIYRRRTNNERPSRKGGSSEGTEDEQTMSGRPEREAAKNAKSKIRGFGWGKGYRLKDGKAFSGLPPLKSNTPQHSPNSDWDIITALFAMAKGGVGGGKNHLQEIFKYTMNDNQRVTHALKRVAAID